MSTRAPIRALAGVAAALGLALAGCGGSGPGASDTSAASLVRADALVFAAIDSDLGSSQWRKVDALSKKFPGREKALRRIEQSLKKDGVDFQDDVEPALGPEVDVAVVQGADVHDTAVAGLTKPDDAGKLKALVEKSNSSPDSGKAVYRDLHDGWFAISDTQAHIDQVLKGEGKSLADVSLYKEAVGKLSAERLASVYVNGPQLGKLIDEAVKARGSGLAGTVPGVTNLDYVSAALSAEDDGLRVHGAAAGAGATDLAGGGDYESELISGVPADAFAFLTFQARASLQELTRNPAFSQALPQIERLLGVRTTDLLALFAGETALYARPGAVIPEISLVLSTEHQAAALATLNRLATRLEALGYAKVTTGHEGGRVVKTIDLGRFSVRFAGLGDRVVLTSGLNGIGSYASSGSKLPDSASFKDAKAAAGMPGSTAGFQYVDLKQSVALIESFAGLSGADLPADLTENLEPLRSFLAWGDHSGDTATFDAFLEIK